MQKHRPGMLVVLDGCGWREDPADNAVRQARTPNFDEFLSTCPHALLQASGKASACLRVKWGIPKSDISI